MEENCSPLNIVSGCSRNKAIRYTGTPWFKSPSNGSNFTKPRMPRFQWGPEVRWNIYAPQELRRRPEQVRYSEDVCVAARGEEHVTQQDLSNGVYDDKQYKYR